jgi:hypothetical protein
MGIKLIITDVFMPSVHTASVVTSAQTGAEMAWQHGC